MKKLIILFAITTLFVIIITLINTYLKTSPTTRDKYCELTGGDVIYPATRWYCSYSPNDPARQIN